MKITRRNFIILGSAAAFAGTNFLTPVSATGQKTQGSSSSLPLEALDDPLFYLTAADFKKHVGTEFLLFTEIGAVVAVLSKVTQIQVTKPGNPTNKKSHQPAAEIFTLSYNLKSGGATQNTYRLQHPKLGEFNLFLVPEANSSSLLHAVINRI